MEEKETLEWMTVIVPAAMVFIGWRYASRGWWAIILCGLGLIGLASQVSWIESIALGAVDVIKAAVTAGFDEIGS
ncbi:hypothetical protein [Stackebrandtia soli]|uniref:hypothetical protein n=1 Tax=Stackebrandtia soli TaxID=1892856 RepID=UPI0039E98235